MWKKIDKNKLPKGKTVAMDGHGNVLIGGVVSMGPHSIICEDSGKNIEAKYYLDPSTLPMPGEVKLDWWEDSKMLYEAIWCKVKFRVQEIAGGGYKALALKGVLKPAPNKIFLGQGYVDSEQAKSACEKYAAEMLNNTNHP